VHGTGVYSVGVGPKGPALERFLDIKKKKGSSKTLRLEQSYSCLMLKIKRKKA
jgi:hypothetical protein